MHPKLNKTIVALRISSVIYFLIALVGLVFFGNGSDVFMLNVTVLALVALCVAMGVFIELVIRGLKNKSRWAWIAAVIICAIYIPSLFIILGIVGLLGLFDREVKKDF